MSGENNVVPDTLSRPSFVNAEDSIVNSNFSHSFSVNTDSSYPFNSFAQSNISSSAYAIALPVTITTDEFAREQINYAELQQELRDPHSSLRLKKIRLANSRQDLFCDCSRSNICPYVPFSLTIGKKFMR